MKTISMQDLAKEIRAFGDASLELQRRSVVRGIARSVQTLVERSPVDTGQYAASWDFTADEKAAIIGNYAPHAPVIEYGARPFMPPLGPLLAWAKRVLQDPSQPPEYSDAVWGLARGTQQKIAREGMKPHFVLTNALPAIIDNIRKEFEGMRL